jgi:hypothetical protein
MLAIAVAALAACGSANEPSTVPATTPSTADRTTAASTTPTASTPSAAPTTNPAVALATGRKLDALNRAYAPVTARVNFLVAAEVLWRDAIANDAPVNVQRDRAGAVRLEALRMAPILVRSQRAVRVQVQAQPEAREVQTLLLRAIANRSLALERLDAVLDASSTGSNDDDVDTLNDAYRSSWDAAARSAREATDAVQELRASLGLEPAPEGALR